MNKVWFTADTHFGHRNIIRYCGRPFLDEREQRCFDEDPRGNWELSDATTARHDAGILEAINARVSKNDILWILGDYCWGKEAEAQQIRAQITCRDVRLVWGNHDHRSVASVFTHTLEQGMIRVRGQKIWLNHYPMRYWDKSFHGSWHLYGHVHNALSQEDQDEPWRLTKDVGVDACDYRPIEFEELEAFMEPRKVAFQSRLQAGRMH